MCGAKNLGFPHRCRCFSTLSPRTCVRHVHRIARAPTLAVIVLHTRAGVCCARAGALLKSHQYHLRRCNHPHLSVFACTTLCSALPHCANLWKYPTQRLPRRARSRCRDLPCSRRRRRPQHAFGPAHAPCHPCRFLRVPRTGAYLRCVPRLRCSYHFQYHRRRHSQPRCSFLHAVAAQRFRRRPDRTSSPSHGARPGLIVRRTLSAGRRPRWRAT